MKRYMLLTRQSIAVGLLLMLSAVFVAAGVSVRYQAVQAAKTQERKLPVYCVDTNEKKVAITFDAAWGAEDTAELLSILDEYNAKVTVFAVGDWVRKYPDAVKAFYNAGHTIGNHSDSHKAYSKLSLEEITADIEKCNVEIENCIGQKPKLLRAPSGDYTNDVLTAAESLSMQTVQWSVDSLDWQGLAVAEMVTRVTGAATNGSIILFHNDVKNTPAALRQCLQTLSEQGYQFVTVEDLLYWDNYRIDATGKQHKAAQ